MELPYKTFEKQGSFEIREYGPFVIAETIISGERQAAIDQGVRFLEGYFSGGNAKSEKLPIKPSLPDLCTGQKKQIQAANSVFYMFRTRWLHAMNLFFCPVQIWVPNNWEDNPALSVQCSLDQRPLIQYSKGVISGYLNLSEADGWSEGHDYRLEKAFTRFILLRYYFEKFSDLGENKIVLEKTIRAFQKDNTSINALFPHISSKDHKPTESRIAFDSDVTGWEKHTISRLTGNLGSEYHKNKLFFEILVNSARNSPYDPYCRPFTVYIHNNETALEKRRQELIACKMASSSKAHLVFYGYSLASPQKFVELYHLKMGPKSTRLHQALIYLQSTTLCAQKVGNCWIKQPMRGLLATLFIELITHRENLGIENAWTAAKALYKEIQKCAAIPTVEELLKGVEMTELMKGSAKRAIETHSCR